MRMEKADADRDDCVFRFVADEEFGLHRARFGAVLRDAVVLRINPAEGEALAIFLRRRPVGIKNVALVKNRIHNLIDEGSVHG